MIVRALLSWYQVWTAYIIKLLSTPIKLIFKNVVQHLSSRSAKVKPQSACNVTETTRACMTMSGDLAALALDYLQEFFVQETPVHIRNKHCSIRKATHYFALQFTSHVLHWRTALLNQPLLADLLQEDQIWGFFLNVWFFFFFPSMMKQAEAGRLAACCFSIHGKDEFRTIKPVSCLNCWVFCCPELEFRWSKNQLFLSDLDTCLLFLASWKNVRTNFMARH